jgi:hypothetical protein
MVVVYGTQLYGRVDHVPGVFYVATKFAHCWYLPLIPLGSYAVIDESADEFAGIPIGWSGKSILWAYLRAAVVLYGIASIVVGAIEGLMQAGPYGPFLPGVWPPIVAGAACFAAVWGSRWLTMPSRMRAYQHAINAGVPHELLSEAFNLEDAEREAKQEAKRERERKNNFPKARVAKAPPAPTAPAKHVVHTPAGTAEDMKHGPKILG